MAMAVAIHPTIFTVIKFTIIKILSPPTKTIHTAHCWSNPSEVTKSKFNCGTCSVFRISIKVCWMSPRLGMCSGPSKWTKLSLWKKILPPLSSLRNCCPFFQTETPKLNLTKNIFQKFNFKSPTSWTESKTKFTSKTTNSPSPSTTKSCKLTTKKSSRLASQNKNLKKRSLSKATLHSANNAHSKRPKPHSKNPKPHPKRNPPKKKPCQPSFSTISPNSCKLTPQRGSKYRLRWKLSAISCKRWSNLTWKIFIN